MSTVYGSNADRLKKAVAKHSSHPSLNSSSVSSNNRTSTASSKYSRASTCSTSSSSSAGSTNMRYQEVAHLMPYIHSNSPASSTQFSNSTDTRRSSRSNSTTLSEVSMSSYRSPKRLFEKSGNDEAPSMVVTRTKNVGHNPDPYMIAPVTPILESDMDKFADYIYENEELKANSDLFLPMRVKELNLDLDNVLRDAYVSTLKQSDKEASDAASTTSSSYSKVLTYEAYDYDTTVPKVDIAAAAAAAAVAHDGPTRKQSVKFGSKVKKFAKKITA